MRPSPRLLALGLLLATPSQQEGAQRLPHGVHAARIDSAVMQLRHEDGTAIPGRVEVTGGWYFTSVGYERFLVASADRQQRAERAEAQLESYRSQVDALETRLNESLARVGDCASLAAASCAEAAASSAGHSNQTLYAVSVVAALSGLLLGMLGALALRQQWARDSRP